VATCIIIGAVSFCGAYAFDGASTGDACGVHLGIGSVPHTPAVHMGDEEASVSSRLLPDNVDFSTSRDESVHVGAQSNAPMNASNVDSSVENTRAHRLHARRGPSRYLFPRLNRALLRGISTFMGIFLMLTMMTYNGFIILSIVFGASIGTFCKATI
jgi:hypothetical protein